MQHGSHTHHQEPFKEDIIEKITFITDGCGASVATASQVTLLMQGQSIENAKKLNADKIDDSLGGLPEDHKHCAKLASNTLKRALKKYENTKKANLE